MVASAVNNRMGSDVTSSARSGHVSGLRAGGEAPLHNFNGLEATMDICRWEQLWLRLSHTHCLPEFLTHCEDLLTTCLKWTRTRSRGTWVLVVRLVTSQMALGLFPVLDSVFSTRQMGQMGWDHITCGLSGYFKSCATREQGNSWPMCLRTFHVFLSGFCVEDIWTPEKKCKWNSFYNIYVLKVKSLNRWK